MVVGPVLVTAVAGSLPRMGMHLTKRRAVDLCRVATCLCPAVI
ncbi:Ms5788A family Cys-rich leader peptide [Micromonosporaceae bacterium DT194]